MLANTTFLVWSGLVSTIAKSGRGAAQAVLPFQSYGALGMARSEFEADSASTQFFWLLFESDLTPAG